jgi:hypothetical protein
VSTTVETSERDFQGAVLDLALACRWRSAHFHDSRRQVKPGVFVGDKAAVGFPDLVLARPPRLLIAELKRDKGQVRKAQREWLDLLASIPQVEVFVWRPKDWAEIEEALR